MKRRIFFIIIIISFIAFNLLEIYGNDKSLQVNILDFSGDINAPKDRDSLAFSDQGAWFAYGFPTDSKNYGGFSGPFLMTEQNGVWCSKVLSQLSLYDIDADQKIKWDGFNYSIKSYNSHLEQTYKNNRLNIIQTLFFSSAHSAIMTTRIKNISKKAIRIRGTWEGEIFLKSLSIENKENGILIKSDKTDAEGYIQVFNDSIKKIINTKKSYSIVLKSFDIKPDETKDLILTHTFIFSQYDFKNEKKNLQKLVLNQNKFLKIRIREKEKQLKNLFGQLEKKWSKSIYRGLLAKALLTLQNNWRIPAGELKHSGLFPSYHYKWFHGFWAWDSWKHAVGLSKFNIELAKEQIRAMFDFEDEKGFIADCVYRDTSIEKHNYRNTKPPLSGWAVWNMYKRDRDIMFLKELYPKILKQHYWWYKNRDNDKDGLCEYGSTDGTLIAAKWESGMDNAVRFDNSKILKNHNGAYSLDQESVDLNSYLYAEKLFLHKMAAVLNKKIDKNKLKVEANALKIKIQNQFFDKQSGWFFDSNLSGENLIKVKGCEGWIPLWAGVATVGQAKMVKENMMSPKYFNLKIPFQTLSADHPKFKPNRGYWRGPVWLDQAYFGVRGLQKYNFKKEADTIIYKLLHNAEGVLEKGKSIRENYNPATGTGMEAQNFSWSAAHYLLLLIKDI